MTPRGTDWSLALLVALGLATGLSTWFAGSPDSAWVFAAHAAAGRRSPSSSSGSSGGCGRVSSRLALGLRTGLGLAALGLVFGRARVRRRLVERLDVGFGGMSLLAGSGVASFLGGLVLVHALARARPLRRADVADRRQFLSPRASAPPRRGVGAAAPAAARVRAPRRGTPVHRLLRAGSFTGNDFPVTSWVADRSAGAVRRRTAWRGRRSPRHVVPRGPQRGDDLDRDPRLHGRLRGDAALARGRIGRLLDEAGLRDGRHVRVVSVTGYRWSFALADARDLLLATHVGDEPLTRPRRALPARRLGHRGFQWVKWVTRVEVIPTPTSARRLDRVEQPHARGAGRGRRGGGGGRRRERPADRRSTGRDAGYAHLSGVSRIASPHGRR